MIRVIAAGVLALTAACATPADAQCRGRWFRRATVCRTPVQNHCHAYGPVVQSPFYVPNVVVDGGSPCFGGGYGGEAYAAGGGAGAPVYASVRTVNIWTDAGFQPFNIGSDLILRSP